MHKQKSEPLSRSQMIQWLNRTLNINETRIENLASGVVFCLLLNHYHPNTIAPSKVVFNAKSPHEFRSNLRRFQEGLAALEIKNITFDPFKVSEMTYTENWNLICKVYRHFNGTEKQKSIVGSQPKWPPKMQENTPFSNPLMAVNALSTPMKGPKRPQEGGKMRWQTMNMIEQIKRIVTVQSLTDRNKVEQLRGLLGLQDDEGGQSECDLKDLLSDYKKQQEIIQID